jgi:hypothetical protein
MKRMYWRSNLEGCVLRACGEYSPGWWGIHMGKKAKKAKTAPKKKAVGGRRADTDLWSTLEEHAEALREHSYELRRNSEALRASLPESVEIATEVPDEGLLHETALAGKPSTEEVRRRLAAATGNIPAALKDDFKVIWMLAGGPAIRDNLMSRINNEFWPDQPVPHLRFNDIKAMNIGLLIARIRQLL